MKVGVPVNDGEPLNTGVPENVGLPEKVGDPAIVDDPKVFPVPLRVRSTRLFPVVVEVIPPDELIVVAVSAPTRTGANEIPASEKLTAVVGFAVSPVKTFTIPSEASRTIPAYRRSRVTVAVPTGDTAAEVTFVASLAYVNEFTDGVPEIVNVPSNGAPTPVITTT